MHRLDEKLIIRVLSRDGVTIDGVWIGNQIVTTLSRSLRTH
jgi:hypothetical protein